MDPDDFDLDDLFDFDDEDGCQPPTSPDLRAVVRGPQLTVTTWAPYLIGEGPYVEMVRKRAESGVTIADLWVEGEDSSELIVRYLAIADRTRADRQLVRWSESVGYRRIWFPDRLVEVDERKTLGVARVECPTCGARWEDGSPGFWAAVRQSGRFPGLCVICHGDLPQWRWRPGTCNVGGLR